MVSSLSSKKRTKTSRTVVKTNSFVRFLEEMSASKNHFEFAWPLVVSRQIYLDFMAIFLLKSVCIVHYCIENACFITSFLGIVLYDIWILNFDMNFRSSCIMNVYIPDRKLLNMGTKWSPFKLVPEKSTTKNWLLNMLYNFSIMQYIREYILQFAPNDKQNSGMNEVVTNWKYKHL